MIKEIARELADAIAGSPEFEDYKNARKSLQGEDTDMQLLEELRQRQWELQLDNLLGRDEQEEGTEEMERMLLDLADNETVNRFLMAEYRFTKVLNEVQNILLSTLDTDQDNNDDLSLH